jgi:hypothetical protein
VGWYLRVVPDCGRQGSGIPQKGRKEPVMKKITAGLVAILCILALAGCKEKDKKDAPASDHPTSEHPNASEHPQ